MGYISNKRQIFIIHQLMRVQSISDLEAILRGIMMEGTLPSRALKRVKAAMKEQLLQLYPFLSSSTRKMPQSRIFRWKMWKSTIPLQTSQNLTSAVAYLFMMQEIRQSKIAIFPQTLI